MVYKLVKSQVREASVACSETQCGTVLFPSSSLPPIQPCEENAICDGGGHQGNHPFTVTASNTNMPHGTCYKTELPHKLFSTHIFFLCFDGHFTLYFPSFF